MPKLKQVKVRCAPDAKHFHVIDVPPHHLGEASQLGKLQRKISWGYLPATRITYLPVVFPKNKAGTMAIYKNGSDDLSRNKPMAVQ
jgi:hypothetical protein